MWGCGTEGVCVGSGGRHTTHHNESHHTECKEVSVKDLCDVSVVVWLFLMVSVVYIYIYTRIHFA